jgi:hypothetical protein
MATANTATQTVYNEITQQVFDPSAGPAADLYRSKYTVSSNFSLSYPKDLESSRKGHAVYFDIYEINPVSLAETLKPFGINLGAPAPAPVTNENGGSTVTDPDQITTEALKSGTKSFFERVISPTAVNIAPRTKDNAVATIALYMPETLNFTYDANYNSLSLSSAINSTPISSLGPGAITSMMENSAVKLAMSAAGYVFNPQQQVLFEGIEFRPYEMTFTFTPTSAEETRNVNAIIKTLRYHAAPQIGGVGGFFFIPPSVFNVSFRYNGKVNPNINLLKRSVLKNVNVNYAPNGWAAFEGNGAPVQTVVSLQFQEIVLVDKTQINQGF